MKTLIKLLLKTLANLVWKVSWHYNPRKLLSHLAMKLMDLSHDLFKKKRRLQVCNGGYCYK